MNAHRRYRPYRLFATLSALTLLFGFSAWAGGDDPSAAAEVEGAAAQDDLEHQRVTIQRTRNTGVAMMSWLTDQMDESPCPDSGETDSESSVEEGKVDWGRCPAISHDELAAMLVPTYLEELPATDGWDHPLEFCLKRERLCDPAFILGVRSSGRDGVWEGNLYPVGSFLPDDVDRDVVWIDGYYVTWPQARE